MAASETLDASATKFTSKEKLLYKILNNYFKKISNEKKDLMFNIIEKNKGDTKLSLRLLDWFITSYSETNCTCYELPGFYSDDEFNVHISYKSQLKSYKKKYFDPFRRRQRFYYNYDKTDPTKKICTTLGQLNFFRWAFTYRIIDYVENNYETIYQAMKVWYKLNGKKKEANIIPPPTKIERPKRDHPKIMLIFD